MSEVKPAPARFLLFNFRKADRQRMGLVSEGDS